MSKLNRKAAIFAACAALASFSAVPVFAQSISFDLGIFHFDHDDRGNVEGKRASCEVYAQIAKIQAEANRKYRCGYDGPRWNSNPEAHFHWCRYVRRETVGAELKGRAIDLQHCFDHLGDFDDDRWERH